MVRALVDEHVVYVPTACTPIQPVANIIHVVVKLTNNNGGQAAMKKKWRNEKKQKNISYLPEPLLVIVVALFVGNIGVELSGLHNVFTHVFVVYIFKTYTHTPMV